MLHLEAGPELKSTFSVPKPQATWSAVSGDDIEKQSCSGKLWEPSGGGRQGH